MNKIEIGKYLKKLREGKGLSLRNAAEAVGTTCKSILDWEKGVMPSNNSLVELAKLYEVTVDDILECGKKITDEELYEKYPIFQPFDYKAKPNPKKDGYVPYQTQLIIINSRLKELILLFRKRLLNRSEDYELRFLFTKMCSFSTHYYKNHDDKNKDKYLCFIEILNEAKEQSQTSNEYYFEVRKHVDITNKGYDRPYPEYGNPSVDSIKDQQFTSLENWEKDFYLAAFQNSDVINNLYRSVWNLKDYEERYGEEFDKEKIVKRLIKYFIENGAVLNPWLFSYKKKKKVSYGILATLEDFYIEYIKPIFIQFYDPKDEECKDCIYAYVNNNEQNRFLNNYDDYLPYFSTDRIDPRDLLKLFTSADEKEIVEFIYSQRYKGEDDKEPEYKYKKARVDNDLRWFYECREKWLQDNETAKKSIEQIDDLETKLNNGETTFFEYEIEDISKNKDFNHWKLMNVWKNMLTYSQFLKKRDKKLTESLLNELDKLSLDEIRNKYFVKEEVEIKDE